MSEPLSQDRLAEIRAAEQGATPGPWEPTVVGGDVQCYRDPGSRLRLNTNKSWAVGPLPVRSGLQAQADANFIALARTAIPELLSEVERLQALNKLRGIDCLDAARDAEARVAELEDELLALDDKTCDGYEPNCAGCHVCGPRRTEAMFAAQARVAELEALISQHHGVPIFACVTCKHCRQVLVDCIHSDCPWGQAAANHRARQAEVSNGQA